MSTLRPVRGMRLPFAILALGLLGAASGCREDAPPLDPEMPAETRGSHHAPPATSLAWQATARDLLLAHNPGPPGGSRQLAYLGMVQYGAVIAAEKRPPRSRWEVQGAVAAASAAVLSHFYAGEAGNLEAQVRAAEPSGAGAAREFRRGEALGRQVAVQVIERADSDGYTSVFTGTIPVGPGYWFSSATPPAPPVLPRLGEMVPIFMTSGSQHRPPPPPTFGSPQYLAGLDEVRQVALARTEEQIRIAQFWALPGGTVLPPGYWNEQGARLVAGHRLSERDAARVFFLLGGVMIDALIAGHDAKYAYWFIRPTQADPSIALAIGLPNHPSYPSTHTALSKSAAGVLGSIFPGDRQRLAGLAEEASMSRLYGGLHYTFDLDAGSHIAKGVVKSAFRFDARYDLSGSR